MTDNKVITIVPALPPTVNGLGDYAYYLAKRLKIDSGIDTLFLKTQNSLNENKHNEFEVECLNEKSSDSLIAFLQNNNSKYIIVNYVGYAYSQRGCPYWLIEGLEKWKKLNPDSKVITIFHELYANGKIWQSAFWLHYFQKGLAFRLYKLSNHALSTGEVTYNILQAAEKKKELSSMPVFSNIGEIKNVVGFSERENVFVIFGSAEKRSQIFTNSSSSLKEWCKKCGVNKIIEIGPVREVGKDNESLKIEIIQLGILSPEKISEVMSKSRYGIVEYPLALLSKSGIFAAYSAHGVIPIVVGKHFMNFECDNLKAGIHYLFNLDSNADHTSVSDNIFQWYQGHNLSSLSSHMAKVIRR